MTPRNFTTGLCSLGWPGLAVVVLLVMPVGLVALFSGLGVIALPFEMYLLDQSLPVVFRLHMVASALVLLLLPAVYAARVHSPTHKTMGRVLGAFVVIGGLTALPVALFSHSSLVARAGFFVQAVVWIGFLWVGVNAIRHRDQAGHIVAMLAMAAVTTGAVWFRMITGTAILLGLPFEPIYAVAAWAGWLIPLAFVGLYRQRLVDWALSPHPAPLAPKAALV
jgi:hypothetical protein